MRCQSWLLRWPLSEGGQHCRNDSRRLPLLPLPHVLRSRRALVSITHTVAHRDAECVKRDGREAGERTGEGEWLLSPRTSSLTLSLPIPSLGRRAADRCNPAGNKAAFAIDLAVGWTLPPAGGFLGSLCGSEDFMSNKGDMGGRGGRACGRAACDDWVSSLAFWG